MKNAFFVRVVLAGCVLAGLATLALLPVRESAAASDPTLSVSMDAVTPGTTISVAWDGGEQASLCVVSFTDATRTNAAPWGASRTGSAVITITSATVFKLTCIDKVSGAYLPGVSKGVRLATMPSVSASSPTTPAGSTISVAWDGGELANTCALTLTDATRTRYQPWASAKSGSGVVTIYSETTFNLTCINSSGNYLPAASTVVRIGEPLPPDPLAQLQARRAQGWASNHSPWEVNWEANGDPAHEGPTWQWWNQPYSDDWEQPWVASTSFAFDTPSPGFFTVDRTAERDIYKPGLLVRYDPLLNSTAGLTLEFRAKLAPNSAENAFNVIYSTGPLGTPTVELFLSPNKIVAGGMNEDRLNPNPPTVAFDTTQWHTYRMVVPAGENRVYLFVDGGSTPLLQAPGNTYKASYLQSDDVPYIMVGSHFAHRPANAVIDFVRYRRGGYAPSSGFPATPTRTPPPLPSSVSASAVPWTTLLDGWSLPQNLGYRVWNDATPELAAASRAAWQLQGGGILEFNSTDKAYRSVQLQLEPVPGLSSSYPRGPYTVEFRAKVLPGTTERGFGFTIFDAATGFSLALSPDKVETYLGWKPAGYQAYAMDTTDGFHTYRFVHPDQSVFAYLYVDDNPVPVIVDQPGSPDGWPGYHIMQFGTLGTADLNRFGTLAGHVLIDYLRVSPTAYAPAQ